MDPITAITNLVSSGLNLFGAKSRLKEIEAQTEAMSELQSEKSKSTTKIIAISGVLLIVTIIIIITLRKK